jgi:uncharacterized damage-inducible protein DinB
MSTTAAASSNNLAYALIAEMEQEAATARTCLDRIPAEKFDWKPHEKSMTFGRLAAHIAEMFGWTPVTLNHSELDFAKMEYTPFDPKSTENWTMRNGETVYFTMPKAMVMRSFVMNHIVHHRGQLSVYLRLNDIAVPSIYGPSADEGQM